MTKGHFEILVKLLRRTKGMCRANSYLRYCARRNVRKVDPVEWRIRRSMGWRVLVLLSRHDGELGSEPASHDFVARKRGELVYVLRHPFSHVHVRGRLKSTYDTHPPPVVDYLSTSSAFSKQKAPGWE